MTQEQREFRIKKITTYEEQIEKLDKKSVINALAVGTSVLAAIVSFSSMYGGWFNSLIENSESVLVGISFLFTSLSSLQLEFLIEDICKKTMLKGKVEDIKFDLEMAGEQYQELKESRGKSR